MIEIIFFLSSLQTHWRVSIGCKRILRNLMLWTWYDTHKASMVLMVKANDCNWTHQRKAKVFYIPFGSPYFEWNSFVEHGLSKIQSHLLHWFSVHSSHSIQRVQTKKVLTFLRIDTRNSFAKKCSRNNIWFLSNTCAFAVEIVSSCCSHWSTYMHNLKFCFLPLTFSRKLCNTQRWYTDWTTFFQCIAIA